VTALETRAAHDPAVALADLHRGTRIRIARRTSVTLVLAAVGAVVTAVGLTLGDLGMPLDRVVAVALGGGDRADQLRMEFRLPRVVLGVLVGVAFAVAGSLFQSVLQNPLASPDIIGVSQGASVGAVVTLLILDLSGIPVSVGALAGGLLIAGLNVLLAWRGGLAGYRFVLCGVALAFVSTSVLGYCLTRSSSESAQTALVWLAGSTSAAEWRTVVPLAVAVAVLVPLALGLSRALGLLEMGDQAAQALGVPPLRTRLVAILVGVVLASAATAAAGPVAFLALVSAPIARRLVADGRPAPLQAALVGIATMAAADLLAESLSGEISVPVGVVTGLIGGPYLVWLMAGPRAQRRIG